MFCPRRRVRLCCKDSSDSFLTQATKSRIGTLLLVNLV